MVKKCNSLKYILSFVFIGVLLFLYPHQVYAQTKPSIINIDTPTQNQVIYNQNILVSGWALNESGIKEVNILIDGQKIANANIGIYRPDVNAVFPGYLNGDHSGYNYLIDINSVKIGSHKLTVQAIGNDNLTVQSNVYISIVKKVPLTNIDYPLNNQEYNNSNITVSGWALNSSGVKSIDLLIDNQKVGNANIGLSRTDVDKAFPGYTGGDKSGFQYTIDISKLSAGSHSIKVQALGNDGDVGERTVSVLVKKPVPRICIDTPVNNCVINGNTLSVAGWALNASGVNATNIYVDDNFLQKATSGLSRADVNTAFPGYIDGDKSGFQSVLDFSKVASGKHKVKIEAIGNDGTKCIDEITVEKLKPLICIDTPSANSTISNNFDIVGWALASTGVQNVNIYLDNIKVGSAAVGLSRNDVGMVFSQYKDASNSGFKYIFDISMIKSGTHTLTVEVVGNDGQTSQKAVSINISKQKPIMTVDTPTQNSQQKEDIFVSGWAISLQGIRQVNIFVDNVFVGNAVIGVERKDVQAVYPNYSDSGNSGYYYMIGVNSIITGSHVIKVQVVGKDDQISEQIVNITKSKVFAIDIGHNVNFDIGATGIRQEDDLTREVGLKVIEKLRSLGQIVVSTLPSSATSVTDSLQQRCDITNRNNADMFVSIHFNCFDGTAKGTEVYAVSDAGRAIAQNVLNNIVGLGYTNRGIKSANYYVLLHTNPPAILIECAFLDNSEDMNRYSSEALANAIVSGLMKTK